MTTLTPTTETVNQYPSERYEIRYDPTTRLFACLYGGEVFDHALSYGDGDAQCALHWTVQEALYATPMTFEEAAYLALYEDDGRAPTPCGGSWVVTLAEVWR